MFVELLTGVRLDRVPLGVGMRIQCPFDVGGHLTEKGWGRKVGAGHRMGDGRALIAFKAREIPGTAEDFSEWPSWMRPAWVRPDGRATLSEDNRQWVPVSCPRCPRYAYGPKDRIPTDAKRETNSDAWLIDCRGCRTRA